MKKSKQKVSPDESLIGQELNILSELLVDIGDFEYEDKGVFYDGGLEYRRVKIVSLKSKNLETNEDGNDS